MFRWQFSNFFDSLACYWRKLFLDRAQWLYLQSSKSYYFGRDGEYGRNLFSYYDRSLRNAHRFCNCSSDSRYSKSGDFRKFTLVLRGYLANEFKYSCRGNLFLEWPRRLYCPWTAG
jgi:hypothetical protein